MGATVQRWAARSVFLSSTFVDMQAERDHLRTRVFPELEERLRAARLHLEWVDLRVGVATASEPDEDGRELQVLKVCLDEVRRCRPFLIVLLGDRYGWVPPPERTQAAATEAGLSGELAGRSVTDLEIEFGVLADLVQQQRSFFYFREPLPYATMPAAVAATFSDAHSPDGGNRAMRLAALKQRIEARMPERVRRYRAGWDAEHHRVSALDDLGRMVLADMWNELVAEIDVAPAELSWDQAERAALDDFTEDRARDFVGREPLLQRLAKHTTGRDDGAAWGVCLTGASGAGKSALFAELYRRLRKSDLIVLAHSAAASVQAASIDGLLRRWVVELADALGVPADLPDDADAETVEKVFGSLLGQAARRQRVVLAIDALDQFEATPRGRYMTWLPNPWPANARLITTAIPGDASNALAARQGVETVTLPGLDADEARGIIAAICARYHRTFEPAVVEALLAKARGDAPAWDHVLWLVLAVEELNLLDADDFARAQHDYTGSPVERLLALVLEVIRSLPPDIPGLYGATFDRAADLFGAPLVGAFLGTVAVSRAGWREIDFRFLLPKLSGELWDELRFASLRRLFRGQLRQRGALGQWDFNHSLMRASARAWFGAGGTPEPHLHTAIVDHLLALTPGNPLRQSETMVHLLGSEDWTRAAQYYGDAKLSEAEVAGATRVLAASVLAAPAGRSSDAMQALAHLIHAPDTDTFVRAHTGSRFLYLSDAIEHQAALSTRLAILELAQLEVQRAVDSGNAGWLRDLFVSHTSIGEVQRDQGDLAGALQSFQASLQISQRRSAEDPRNVDRLSDLITSHNAIGVVQLAQGNLVSARQSFQVTMDIVQRLRAEDPRNNPLRLRATLRDLSVSHDRIGDVQHDQGDLAGALQSFQDSLEIRLRLSAQDPRNTDWLHGLLISHMRIGDVQRDLRDFAGALRSSQASLEIGRRLSAEDPGNAKWLRALSLGHSRVGDARRDQGDLVGAVEAYRASFEIARRLAGQDPGNAGWQRDLSMAQAKLGDVCLGEGDLAGAFEAYCANLEIVQRLLAQDPNNPAWLGDLASSHESIGDVRRRQGDLAGTLEAYRASLEIRQRLSVQDPSHGSLLRALWVIGSKVGDVRRDQGDLAGALEAYQASLEIAVRLSIQNPHNAGWQRDVSFSHEKLADVFAAQGLPGAALESLRASFLIRDRLVAATPDDVPLQLTLVGLLWKLAGLGDEPRRRMQTVLAILTRLDGASKLSADIVQWIPTVEAQLRKLQ
jgi:tetratricopeptide (TPR) repeat protein